MHAHIDLDTPHLLANWCKGPQTLLTPDGSQVWLCRSLCQNISVTAYVRFCKYAFWVACPDRCKTRLPACPSPRIGRGVSENGGRWRLAPRLGRRRASGHRVSCAQFFHHDASTATPPEPHGCGLHLWLLGVVAATEPRDRLHRARRAPLHEGRAVVHAGAGGAYAGARGQGRSALG